MPKVDILAIGAHPDDVELSCSGLLAKEIAHGKTVAILDLTKGELGTNGSEATRAKEANLAAELLGAVTRRNLGLPDAFFENNKTNKLKVVEQIRDLQPDVVICNAIDDRHIDHPRGAQLVHDACFLSGLAKITTTWKEQQQQKWRPKHVLHYIQWFDLKPDVIIDISGFINKKIEVVKAYQSQFYQPNHQQAKTPISSKNFLDSVEYRARNLGRVIGKDHAEGYNIQKPVALNSIDDLI
ncbi:MAG: bacillithiol biosynthesis deacetylase BshB1 [Psychroflexus sp.]|jgi:bacillithiol biosynthesis deacetylase BshB1|nr:bacillithiol biosynthesis deacetylase BshB1 [Psychroflexus sp.]MDR9448360.1 bacillithiol biosynthesis deacetylase BshB1 [Psychroflexus sp.]